MFRLDDVTDKDPLRYPLIHAFISRKEVGSLYKFYIKFIVDTFTNKFEFEIDGVLHHCMNGEKTLMRSKYVLLPSMAPDPKDI